MDIKKHRTLFLLGGIFIVLVLIYLALSSYQWDADEADSGEDSQIQVTDLGELSSFQFTDQSTGTGMSFVKEDGTWYMADDREIPLDQTYIDAMENTYASLTATRQIDEPDALSDYGLDSPAYTVQATDADGNTTTFSVGDAADEDYYLTVDSAQAPVYTVTSSAVSVLQYDLDTLVEKDTMPAIGSGNLLTAEFTENGQTTTYSSDDEEQSETIATIAGGYGAMTLTDLASYHATAEELTTFGLDEASRTTVTLTYQESSSDSSDSDSGDSEEEDSGSLTYTLYLGSDSGDGTRYVQVQDSDLVYLVSSDVLNNLLGIGNSTEE